MNRFEFGVLIGIVGILFSLSRGADRLRTIGVNPDVVFQAAREMERVFERIDEQGGIGS
jgi:hypothetical protein